MFNKHAHKFAILSMLVAVAAGFALWFLQVSYNRPRIVGRPHWLMWDVVSFSLRAEGQPTMGAVSVPDGHPLLSYSSWFFRRFGHDYRAIVAAQLPFVVLLMLSVGLAAWRVAGPVGGALGCWVALFGPMTIGLTSQMDDVLMLQAWAAFAMAVLLWSNRLRWAWLAVVGAVLFTHGVRWRMWFSSEVWTVISVLSGFGPWLLWAWGVWLWGRFRRPDAQRSPAPWILTVVLVVFMVLLLSNEREIDPGYLLSQNDRPEIRQRGLINAPAAIWMVPSVWLYSFFGPFMAAVFPISTAAAWFWNRRRDILTYLAGVIVLPTVLLVLINKRQDFYIAGAVPAAYVTISIGLAELLRRKNHLFVVGTLLLAMLAAGWAWEFRNRGTDPNDYLYPASYGKVFEFMPFRYLVNPSLPPNEWETLGHWIDRECTAKRLPTVFVEDYPGNGPPAFYVWFNNPHARIGNVFRGPLIDPPVCMVFLSFNYRGYNRELKDVLADQREMLARQGQPLSDEGLARVNRVAEYSDTCSLAGRQLGWATYHCFPPKQQPPSQP